MYKHFQLFHDKRVKGFKVRDMVSAWEKIAGNLDFVKYSNFITGSTEAAVRSCSNINSEKNTTVGVLLL